MFERKPPAGRLPPVSFPAGFSWGVSTASYQIEGAANEDGRGRSIWDTFSHEPGRVSNGDTGDIACDHYHRLDEDLDLLADLGVQVYRFSIAWPRVQPGGRGQANQAGIAFYNRLIDGCIARRIKPVPTLYHWDLPQALQDNGGWTNREIIDAFADYAAILFDAFGDCVQVWTTLNEPWCSAYLGHRIGVHAPGIADEHAAAAAHHHLLLSHAAAVEQLRTRQPGAKIGIALNLMHIYPASDHPDDVAAAAIADAQLNGSFLSPLFAGHYPANLGAPGALWRPGGGLVRHGDLERIAKGCDFLSINSYHPRWICAPERLAAIRAQGFEGGPSSPLAFGLPIVDVTPCTVTKTAMGWPVYAAGLHDLLVRLSSDYPGLPLYISENGFAAADYLDQDGASRDPERVTYLDAHIRAAHAAIAAGVDLRGYWAWSLMDNFEWSFGYSIRFGLVYVHYPTGERTPKSSFRWFKDVIAFNGIPAAADRQGVA